MTITLSRRALAMAAAAAAAVLLAYLLGTRSAPTRLVSGIAPVADAAGAATTGITVSGTGTVTGTPDTLLLDIGVSVNGSTVSKALAAANAKAAALQKSLRGNGVAAKDIRTSGLSIYPTYPEKGGTPTGYEVSETVSATLRDLGRAGDAIGEAAAAGGNATRVNGISLDLDDTSALVSDARGRAFAEAKAKAEQYAEAAGVSLGRVLRITDSIQGADPQPYPATGRDAAALADKAVPISAGSQDVEVTVTVVFALG
jgi:uncharacterized protein YggE